MTRIARFKDRAGLWASLRFGRRATLSIIGIALFWAPPALVRAGDLRGFVSLLYPNGVFLNDDQGDLDQISNSQLQQDLSGELSSVNSGVTSSNGLAALTSSISGSTFNVATGMPVATTNSLGPIFGERADTLGANHFTLSAYYQSENFVRLNGFKLSRLPVISIEADPTTPPDVDTVTFTLDLKVSKEVTSFAATYGVTDRLDIGVVVPIVQVTAKAFSTATIQNFMGDGDLIGLTPTTISQSTVSTSSGGSDTGIGDIILRAKYRVTDPGASFADVAIVGLAQLPTGDARNLLGSGSTDLMGEVVVSKQFGPISPHLNLGYEQAWSGVDKSTFHYTVGADARLTPDVTLAADLLGDDQINGENIVDAALGGKIRLGKFGVVSASVILPLNENVGIRPDYSYFVGFEAHF